MTTALPFIDELRRMPADRLEEAVDYIHALLEERRVRRERMIDEMDSHVRGNDEEEKLRASRV
jgi:hypothetical protein